MKGLLKLAEALGFTVFAYNTVKYAAKGIQRDDDWRNGKLYFYACTDKFQAVIGHDRVLLLEYDDMHKVYVYPLDRFAKDILTFRDRDGILWAYFMKKGELVRVAPNEEQKDETLS